LDHDAHFHISASEYIAKKKGSDKGGIFLAHPQVFLGGYSYHDHEITTALFGQARGPSCPNRHPNWGKGPIFKTGGEREFFFDRMRTKEYKKECKKKKINALFWSGVKPGGTDSLSPYSWVA
jgi:hypothetical protein